MNIPQQAWEVKPPFNGPPGPPGKQGPEGPKGEVGEVGKLENGTAPAPALAFANDTDLGLYRIGANRMGLVTNGGINGPYLNTDGALVLPDVASGDSLTLGAGTSAGTVVLGFNRFLRAFDSSHAATWRVIGTNTVGDIVIGGESGPSKENSIVIREAKTELKRKEAIVLELVEEEVKVPKKFSVTGVAGFAGIVTITNKLEVTGTTTVPTLVANVVQASFGTAAGGATAFSSKAEGKATVQTELRNNGVIILRTGTEGDETVQLAISSSGAYKVTCNKVGLYGVAPVARAAAIVSPAETLAGLKTAVDALRVAVKNIGITE